MQFEEFCLNAALAFVYLIQAVEIDHNSSELHPSLADMKAYLINKGE
jgi:hypothetical protein